MGFNLKEAEDCREEAWGSHTGRWLTKGTAGSAGGSCVRLSGASGRAGRPLSFLPGEPLWMALEFHN